MTFPLFCFVLFCEGKEKQRDGNPGGCLHCKELEIKGPVVELKRCERLVTVRVYLFTHR